MKKKLKREKDEKIISARNINKQPFITVESEQQNAKTGPDGGATEKEKKQ